MRKRKGFTLIELILSIVLVGVILISMIGALLKLRESYDIINNDVEVRTYKALVSKVINDHFINNGGIKSLKCTQSACDIILGNDKTMRLEILTTSGKTEDIYNGTNTEVIGKRTEEVTTLKYYGNNYSYLKTIKMTENEYYKTNKTTVTGYKFVRLTDKQYTYTNIEDPSLKDMIVNITIEMSDPKYNIDLYSSSVVDSETLLKNQTLTYNNMGGSGCYTTVRLDGTKWGTLCEPTRNNYEFMGWYTQPDGGSQVTSETTVKGSITVYARWEPARYVSCLPGTYLPKGQATCSECPANKYCPGIDDVEIDDVVDQGLADCPVGTVSIAGSTNVTQCRTVAFSLTFDANGGNVNTAAQNITYGREYNSLPTPTKTNYSFLGWYTPFNGTNTYVDMGDEYKFENKISIHLSAYMSNWSLFGTGTNSKRLISCNENGGWSIEADNTGNIVFANYDKGVGNKNAVASVTFTSLSSGWHDFDLLFDGEYTYGYVDGVLVATSQKFTSGKIGYNSTNSILIGAEVGNGSTPTGNYFNGYIGNIIIRNSNERIPSNTYNSITAPNQNLQLYAKWQANSYTVAFECNGGECPNVSGATSVEESVEIVAPRKTFTVNIEANGQGANITQNGNAVTSVSKDQVFKGWTSTTIGADAKSGSSSSSLTTWDGSLTNNTYFSSLKDSGTVTLVANWEEDTIDLPEVTKTGYVCGYSTSILGDITYTSGGNYPMSVLTSSSRLYVKCTQMGYIVAYETNGGVCHGPSTASYDTEFMINDCSKSFTVTIDDNSQNADISSYSASQSQTFAGWSSSTVGSHAKTGSSISAVTTDWDGTLTTNKYFKNLTDGQNVTMVANWTPTAVTLPTITKDGYTCGFATSVNGDIVYQSGGTYTPTNATSNASTLYAKCVGNKYTAKFYYQSNSNSGSTSISSKTVECTVTRGSTCTIDIPDEVRSSVGTYNNEYDGLSVSTGTMSVNVNKNTTTLTLSTSLTEYYAVYSTPVTIYYPTADTKYNVTKYRNQWFTSKTALSNTIIASSERDTSSTSMNSYVDGYEVYGYTLATDTNTKVYNTLADLAISDSTTVYQILSKNVEATFYYSTSNDGNIGSKTASATKYIRCTSVGSEISNSSFTSPTLTGENAPSGTISVGWSSLSDNMGTSIPTTEHNKYYKVYSNPITIYYPDTSDTVSSSDTSLYRNAYINTDTPTVGTTKYTVVTAATNSGTTQIENISLENLKGTLVGLNATVNNITDSNIKALDEIVASNTTTYYAVTNETKEATFYYSSSNTGAKTSSTASGTQTYYCSSTSEIGTSNGNITPPTTTAPYGTTLKGWATSSSTLTTVTPTTANATYYAVYAKDDGNIKNYYYSGSTYTNRSLYRYGVYGINTNYTMYLSSTKDSLSSYTTATGPASSTWTGLATANNTTTPAYTSVGTYNTGAAYSNSTALYTIYQFNISYQKGANVSSIGTPVTGEGGTYCRVNATGNTSGGTSCNVTNLPSITPNDGYETVGWSTTSGDTTGTAVGGTRSINANPTTLYGNAKSSQVIVTANANGGTIPTTTGWTNASGNATATKTVTYNQIYGTLPEPTKTGYTFYAWNGKNKLDYKKYLNLEDFTISANAYQWAAINLDANKTYKVSIIYKNGFDGKNNGYLLLSPSKSPNSSGNWTSIAHNTVPNTTHSDYIYTTDSSGIIYIGYYSVTQSNLNTIWANTDVQIEEGSIATTFEPYGIARNTTVVQSNNHTITAVWKIDNPATPTITVSEGNATQIYGAGSNTLTCATATTYATGVTTYYSFGYATSDGGTPSNWTTPSTLNTYTINATDYTGDRYWSCRVYVTDGTQTSETISSTTSSDVLISRTNAQITLNANNCGTIGSGTNPFYVKYNSTDKYTTLKGTATATMPTFTAKDGYTFNGWYSLSSGGSKVLNTDGTLSGNAVANYTSSSAWLATSNQDLYAQCTAKTYTITADADGGTIPTTTGWINATGNASATKSVTYDSTYGTLPTPTRTGYTFNGWYTAKTGGTEVTSSTVVHTVVDYTMYARWTAITYGLILDYNDGNLNATDKTIHYGNAYGELVTPTRTGYSFQGWSNTYNFGDSTLAASTSDYNYFKVYNYGRPGITYTIKMDSASVTSGSATVFTTLCYDYDLGRALASKTTSFGNNIEYSITCPIDTGYSHDLRLLIYSGEVGKTKDVATRYANIRINTTNDPWNSTYNASTIVTTANHHTLFAKWTPKTYSIKYNANGGSGAPSDTTYTYDNSNTYLSSTIPTRTGYTFAGWSQSSTATSASYAAGSAWARLNIPGNGSYFTLYAVWTANTYTITADADGGTIPTTTGWTNAAGNASATKSVTYDSTYGTLPTPTRTGYTFNGWYTAKTGGTEVTSSTVVHTVVDYTMYARWTANTYTVNYNCGTGATGTPPSPQTGTYGQTFTTATTVGSCSKAGYQFNKWLTTEEINNSSLDYKYTNYSGIWNWVDGQYGVHNNEVTLYAQWTGCTEGTYSNGSVCSNCPTADSGWTATSPATSSSYTQCYEYKKPDNCSSGSVKRVASSATAYSTTIQLNSTLKAKANYYTTTTAITCSACSSIENTSGKYTTSAANTNSGASACYIPAADLSGKYVQNANEAPKTCPKGSYCPGTSNIYYGSTGGSVPCAKDSYTDTTGQSSCTDCPTSNYHTASTGSKSKSSCIITCSATSHVATADNNCELCGTGTTTSQHDVQAGNTSVCSSITVTASFNRNCPVDGSGGQTSNVTATYGSAMPAISTTAPTCPGMTFAGWSNNESYSSGTLYYNANGGSARNSDLTSNTVLYGRWTGNSYKLRGVGPNLGTGSFTVDTNPSYNNRGTISNITNGIRYAAGAHNYSGVVSQAVLQANTSYIITFDIQKVSGTLKNIGGEFGTVSSANYSGVTVNSFKIDGTASTMIWSVESNSNPRTNVSDNTTKHTVKLEVTIGSNGPKVVRIQPNRTYTDTVTVDITNFRIYEIVKTNIGTKTYNSLYTTSNLADVTKSGYVHLGWFGDNALSNQLTTNKNFTTANAEFENIGTANTDAYIFSKIVTESNAPTFCTLKATSSGVQWDKRTAASYVINTTASVPSSYSNNPSVSLSANKFYGHTKASTGETYTCSIEIVAKIQNGYTCYKNGCTTAYCGYCHCQWHLTPNDVTTDDIACGNSANCDIACSKVNTESTTTIGTGTCVSRYAYSSTTSCPDGYSGATVNYSCPSGSSEISGTNYCIK